MVTSRKPTVSTNNTAQMRAVQQAHQYTTRPVLGQPDVWTVSHRLTHAEYRVDLRTGTCTCPHFVERCAPKGETCKHFELVNLVLLTSQQRPQPEPVPARKSTWSEMSRAERLRLLSNGCDF